MQKQRDGISTTVRGVLQPLNLGNAELEGTKRVAR
jgi:hypothetical protein